MGHPTYKKSELILPLRLEKKACENIPRDVQLAWQHIKYWTKDMFRSQSCSKSELLELATNGAILFKHWTNNY